MLKKEKLLSERRDVSTLSILRLLLLKMHVVKLQMSKDGLDVLLHGIDMIILNVMRIMLQRKLDGLLHGVEMTRLNKMPTLLEEDWFGRMQIVER
jgi:hypothetical protein